MRRFIFKTCLQQTANMVQKTDIKTLRASYALRTLGGKRNEMCFLRR